MIISYPRLLNRGKTPTTRTASSTAFAAYSTCCGYTVTPNNRFPRLSIHDTGQQRHTEVDQTAERRLDTQHIAAILMRHIVKA